MKYYHHIYIILVITAALYNTKTIAMYSVERQQKLLQAKQELLQAKQELLQAKQKNEKLEKLNKTIKLLTQLTKQKHEQEQQLLKQSKQQLLKQIQQYPLEQLPELTLEQLPELVEELFRQELQVEDFLEIVQLATPLLQKLQKLQKSMLETILAVRKLQLLKKTTRRTTNEKMQ